MKKVSVVLVAMLFALVVNAQEKWQITRANGANIKSEKMFLEVDKQGNPTITTKGKVSEAVYKVVVNNNTQLVFDLVSPLQKTRYTLIRHEKYASLTLQVKDDFSGEITKMIFTIKPVDI
jgi:hypothetical protein